MSSGTHSSETADFTVSGHKYQINLLSVREAYKLQFTLGNQIKGVMGEGKGNIDPDAMWDIAEKIFKFAEVDGAPLDMEKHFVGKLDQLDFCVVEALKVNAPGFFSQLSGLLANVMGDQLGSEKSKSPSPTSNPATAKSAKQ